MIGFTDIHSHFIYGVDDGARTQADMEAMLDAAYADGIASLFATPHVTPGLVPFNFTVYRQRLDEARGYCRRMGYAMTLYSGAEIMYTPALQDSIVDHRLPTLGDSNYVLMEFVPHVTLKELESSLELMERYGYVTVMAHIERYACLLWGNRVEKLKARHDVRCQVNANTALSGQGFLRTRQIQSWFEKGQIDFVASDAHNVRNRLFRMKSAFNALKRNYGQTYAESLTGAQSHGNV